MINDLRPPRVRVLPPAALAVVAALAAWAPGPARAVEECVWGKPGYRACVEGLIADMKKKEAGRAPQAKPSGQRKTAPVASRPGSLTPVPSPEWRGVPRPGTAEGARNQAIMNQGITSTQQRLNSQAAPPQIIQPTIDYYPVPGRICPLGGC